MNDLQQGHLHDKRGEPDGSHNAFDVVMNMNSGRYNLSLAYSCLCLPRYGQSPSAGLIGSESVVCCGRKGA